MTARNPLFEFMPYGAPELLAAQRPSLLRALVLASGLALAAFMLAQSLGLSVPIQPIEIPIVAISTTTLQDPPSIIESKPKGPPSVIPSPPRVGATPVIVEQVIDPPVVEPVDFGFGTEDGTGETAKDPPSGGGAIAGKQDKEPVRGEWIYTDEMPVAVRIVKPIYPELAKDLGVEGPVYVYVLVGKDGRVMRAEADEKNSVPMLTEAALTAARQWVFSPALSNRHPVMVWVGEKFVFKLH